MTRHMRCHTRCHTRSSRTQPLSSQRGPDRLTVSVRPVAQIIGRKEQSTNPVVQHVEYRGDQVEQHRQVEQLGQLVVALVLLPDFHLHNPNQVA